MMETEVRVAEDFVGLLMRLEEDFPELRFRPGSKFAFRPPRTIIYTDADKESRRREPEKTEQSLAAKINECVEIKNNYLKMQLLHEVGHAILEHRNWGMDLERVKMEGAAWAEAEKLCVKYGVKYDENFAEEELDSYRDWLYARSTCAECGLTMYQTPDGKYHCPQCEMYR